MNNMIKKLKVKFLSLAFVWGIRLKYWAVGTKLLIEGDKLRVKGTKFRARGYKLWADCILKRYGNIKMEWKNWSKEKKDYECHLETGEVFKP